MKTLKLKMPDGKIVEAEVMEEDSNPSVDKNWRAKQGGEYWWVNDYSATAGYDLDYRKEVSWYRYSTLNYFKTEEEAEAKVKRDLAIGRVTRKIWELNDGWEADWKDPDQVKFSLYYDHRGKCVDVPASFSVQEPSILPFAKSEEILEQVKNEHKEDLDTIFGV